MRNFRWIVMLGAGALLAPMASSVFVGQEPAPAPASAPEPATQPALGKPKKQKHSHFDDFLIRGTVFDHRGLSFPGVQLRIRRAGEKKFRWERATNSRGEFGISVPQGSEYEMVVHAKGFLDQTRGVNAKTGSSEERMVFRMERAPGGKK